MGSERWTLLSRDSIVKSVALLPEVSITPAHVFRVYGTALDVMLKASKKSDLASDLLLCSSRTTYILTAFCFSPVGYTVARQILEHERGVILSPQISVHLDITGVDELSFCSLSPPFGASVTSNGRCKVSGCKAVMCLLLPHSEQSACILQSLTTCLVDPQHLKQMPFCLRKAILSLTGLLLNPLHLFRGWGFL